MARMGYTRREFLTPMPRSKRLWPALGAYACLAIAAYASLEDPFRGMVWILCGGLTVLTLAHFKFGEK